MNNTTDIHPNEIPANAIVAMFDYAKPLKSGGEEVTHRTILLGREFILPLLRGGLSWGRSNTGNRFVALHRADKTSREYLQGVEVDGDKRQIKRFDFSRIRNLQVVEG